MRTIAGGLVMTSVFLGLGVSTMLAQEDPTQVAQNTAAATTAAATAAAPAPAAATQSAPEEPVAKRVTTTAGFDFASAYMFRGIYQEDQGVIVPPFVDVGVLLYQGKGALSSITANGGIWNSLHSGPSGNDGRGSPWYEADYYGAVTFTMGKWKPGALFTSYTSPNDAFRSVHEIAAVLAYDDSGSRFPLSPKATLAFELQGQADGGEKSGTYLELGVRPTVKLINAQRYPVSLAIPLKLGLSVRDYYEGPAGNDHFGYFDTGLIASVPLAFMPAGSSWEVRGGVDFLWLGDNLRLLNRTDSTKPVGVLGLSVTY
jgi:hypothetical protein